MRNASKRPCSRSERWRVKWTGAQFSIGTAASAAPPARHAHAQEAFPSRAITILNAFPPGGANDLVTRPIASALEADFQAPGRGRDEGWRGWRGRRAGGGDREARRLHAALAQQRPFRLRRGRHDLFGRQPKTTRADFIPLARLSADPVLLLVNDQQPWKTLEEFIADAKKEPGKIVYSSGGFYGASHLPGRDDRARTRTSRACAICRRRAAARQSPPCSATTRRCTTQTVQASLSHVKAGKLRALASYGTERSKALPDVPTMKEKGFDLVYYLWVGLFAPKGTPAPVVSTLAAAIDKAGASEQFKTAMANIGIEPSSSGRGVREVLGRGRPPRRGHPSAASGRWGRWPERDIAGNSFDDPPRRPRRGAAFAVFAIAVFALSGRPPVRRALDRRAPA